MTPDSGPHLLQITDLEPPQPKATSWFRQNWLAIAGLAIWFDRSAFYVNPLMFVLVCAVGNLVVDWWEWET